MDTSYTCAGNELTTYQFNSGSMSFFQSSTVQLAEASLTKISFIKKNGVPETAPKIIQTGHYYLKLSNK